MEGMERGGEQIGGLERGWDGERMGGEQGESRTRTIVCAWNDGLVGSSRRESRERVADRAWCDRDGERLRLPMDAPAVAACESGGRVRERSRKPREPPRGVLASS